ncbi:reverse transcriptase domain-containing protein, partial [Tanacetum coccineum]
STYNLEPHMRSERWPRIEGYIQAQFGKSYNTNKATLKREHWIRDPETGAYDLDRIRRGKPDEYTDDEWEKYINFWNDPANAQRAETNRLNRSKSTVVSRHGSRSIPLIRHLMKMTSATQEEPSEIDTFYRLHTVNGVFQDPEALRMYDRMRELEATGEHTTAEINAMIRGGKLDEERQQVLVDFFRKKSGNAAVQAVYKKKLQTFPSDMSLGKIPLKDKTLEVKSVEKSFTNDMSLGNLLRPWHQFLDQKIRGAHFSLGIFAGERFAIELTPSTFPQRHFAGDRFPQRHVAGERVGMLLGKASNVVVITHCFLFSYVVATMYYVKAYQPCYREDVEYIYLAEPGEMAPKSSRAVVMPKFDMHTYTFTLTSKELKDAITEYCILMDLHPRLPPSGLTMDKLPSRYSDTDVQDDFPNNYNEEHAETVGYSHCPSLSPTRHLLYLCGLTTTCRHPELRYEIKDSEAQVISMDDFLQLLKWNGTIVSKTIEPIPENQRPQPHVTLPLTDGEPILEKSPAQKAVEKPNSKIAAARKEKDKQSLAKAQTKHTGEESSAAPRKKRARKNQEAVNSGSDRTISITPLHHASPKLVDEIMTSAPKTTIGIIAGESQTANIEKEPDPSLERVGLSDSKLLFALHSFSAGLASTNFSVFPVQPTLSILHIRKREEARLNMNTLSDFQLEELNRLRNDLQKVMQTNDGLSKQISLLDSVYSSSEDKECELADQLKEMEKERDNWRRTTSEQVEQIKAEIDCHKLIREFISEVMKRLHASSEYRKSLAIPVGLCFTVGWSFCLLVAVVLRLYVWDAVLKVEIGEKGRSVDGEGRVAVGFVIVWHWGVWGRCGSGGRRVGLGVLDYKKGWEEGGKRDRRKDGKGRGRGRWLTVTVDMVCLAKVIVVETEDGDGDEDYCSCKVVISQEAQTTNGWRDLRRTLRPEIKILLQQIGAIRGTQILKCQQFRMTGPTPEPITPLNHVVGSNNNHDHPPSLQDQILNHISSLETLIKQHNEKAGTLITPIRLTFGEEVEGNKGKDKGKGLREEVDEDLKKPYKEVLKSPFTRRIIEISAPSHQMPTNMKIYDGPTYLDDHITHFVGATNQGEWEMPVWCRMFQQTLDEPARGWFDRMPKGCIDSWADLCEKFALRRKYSKDPTEVSKIIQRAKDAWGLDILGQLPKGPGRLEFIIVAIDYFTKWMEAKPLAKTTGKEVKKFVWENIVCGFGLPRVIVTDNRMQLVNDPFKSWCEKWKIKQMNTTVAHPQANGLVERATKSLMHGLKARLGRERVGWVDELPNILWAHRTMLKTSNGETLFNLTYGCEAVIPAEIGMPTYRII